MIGRELFDAYAEAIDANAELLAEAVESLASRLESAPPAADPARTAAAAYAALVAEYGAYAAEIACDFYALARDAAGAAGSFEPEMAPAASAELVAEDAEKASKAHPDAPGALRSLAGTAVQRAMQRADSTISSNAARDPAHPKWALVPQAGACGFCVMIASNGFVFSSKATAHSRHASCRCRPVADFDAANPSLAGYDPEAMQGAYRDCRAAVEADAREKWRAMSAAERAKWASSGRGGWDHYLRNRIAAEMDSRDRVWLQTGKPPEVEFASPQVRKRATEAEVGTARRLSEHGVRPVFVQDYRWERDESGRKRKIGLPDLGNGIEIKTLGTSGNAWGAMGNYLDSAEGKEGVSCMVVDNSESENISDADLVAAAKALSPGYEGVPHVRLLLKSGEYILIK